MAELRHEIMVLSDVTPERRSDASRTMKRRLCGHRRITRGEHGKPLADGIHFNVSHDEAYVVGVSHPTRPVGVDVVFLQREVNIKHFHKHFTPAEWRHIGACKQQLLVQWCYKEAFLKMIGTGFATHPQRVHISHDRAVEVEGQPCECTFEERRYGPYLVVACVGPLASS